MDGKYYVVLCRFCKRHSTIKLTNQQYLKKKVRCKICGKKGEVHESLPREFQPKKIKLRKLPKPIQKGACLGCGRMIPPDRLRAMPGTNLCIRCAQK